MLPVLLLMTASVRLIGMVPRSMSSMKYAAVSSAHRKQSIRHDGHTHQLTADNVS
jgi:hypothetical protein